MGRDYPSTADRGEVLLDAPSRSASLAAVDKAIGDLRGHARELAALSLDRRIELTNACAKGVVGAAREWVEAACEAKRIPPASPARAEEILAGPVAVLRYLRLLGRSLADIRREGAPRLTAEPYEKHGQLRVPVFPTRSLYDRLLFRPMTAETWMRPETSLDELFGTNVDFLMTGNAGARAVAAVLGAGNVSAIPITDALTKILQESRAVLLKMNPVNAYLGPIFERALAPLIIAGILRVTYGGAEVGKHVVEHDGINEVHITGSIDTHDAIVWGANPSERARRRTVGIPVLVKPITSELGNVTPWIVVPGRYSTAELRFQAESIAASIVNNASFNCVATKVIVTCKDWPDRDRFLDMIQEVLRQVPPRYAYYPAAAARFSEFARRAPDDPEYLPWTLIRDTNSKKYPNLFARESFVCVCAETALPAESPEQFLSLAVEFANDRLWGTLAAAVTVPAELRRRSPVALDLALRKLHYGTIGVNQWPGVAYALMSPPWGGYPDSDLADVQSGIGFVHNTYLLAGCEKTVLYCPLKFFPKPVWFPSHRNAGAVAWSLFDLYTRPSIWRLARVVKNALQN
jgi:acyl-CoA reductase-like NAD-dependent aldehyde dehydrogenase